jgi:hypothetical protein
MTFMRRFSEDGMSNYSIYHIEIYQYVRINANLFGCFQSGAIAYNVAKSRAVLSVSLSEWLGRTPRYSF